MPYYYTDFGDGKKCKTRGSIQEMQQRLKDGLEIFYDR